MNNRYEQEPLQKTTLRRVFDYAKGTREPPSCDLTRPPNAGCKTEKGDISDIQAFKVWKARLHASPYDVLSHDLECAGRFIICHGICPVSSSSGAIGQPYCVRYRGRRGVQVWKSKRLLRSMVSELSDLLLDERYSFLGHNVVGFDIPILEGHGLPLGGGVRVLDSMLMMNRLYSELPKGLQYTSTLFCQAPVWKKTLTAQSEDKED